MFGPPPVSGPPPPVHTAAVSELGAIHKRVGGDEDLCGEREIWRYCLLEVAFG